jgi:hypothetical protein
MTDEKCLVLFIKSPEKGMVKSRLAKDTDENTALSLYRLFVMDLLKTLKTGWYSLRIYFSPPDAADKLSAWLGEGYSYLPQKGTDLGARMKNAFRDTFAEGFKKVLLIGSDVPDLSCSILNEAFTFDHCDAVLGPSPDGGYYLIGFRHDTFTPEIFEGIQWGTEHVFRNTMAVFHKKKRRVQVLPPKMDIDRIEDLRAFFEQNRNTSFADSRTMQFIRNNFETLFGEKKNA